MEVSSADFSDFDKQIEDAVVFVRKNENSLSLISEFPGVDWLFMDFGVEVDLTGPISFAFTPELESIAGRLGISLMLSLYRAPEDGEVNA